MYLRVVGDDRAGVEKPGRIEQVFDCDHDLVQLIAVLATHIGRHHPSGAVLGFERALIGQNQTHHVLGEAAVATKLAVIVEAVGEHEVDIAVLGMSEDHRVAILVPVEQRGQLRAGVGQSVDRNDHVLQQRGGSGSPGAGDRGVQPLA